MCQTITPPPPPLLSSDGDESFPRGRSGKQESSLKGEHNRLFMGSSTLPVSFLYNCIYWFLSSFFFPISFFTCVQYEVLITSNDNKKVKMIEFRLLRSQCKLEITLNGKKSLTFLLKTFFPHSLIFESQKDHVNTLFYTRTAIYLVENFVNKQSQF